MLRKNKIMQNLIRAIVSAFLVTLGLLAVLFAVAAFQVFSGLGEWNEKWNAENMSLLLYWGSGIFVACVVIFLFAGRK